MKERPILMSATMVRAILSGAKTQTRRVVKRVPDANGTSFTPGELLGVGDWWSTCPYGVPGDRLWVRETCIIAHKDFPDFKDPAWPRDNDGVPRIVQYLATHPDREHASDYGYTRATPSIHMPRWASRITLEITEVRVERLQSITPADAVAEGAADVLLDRNHPQHAEAFARGEWTGDEELDVDGPYAGAVHAFSALWDSINGKRAPWASNPWVFVVAFRKVCP
jgi:hypothetical protein